MTETPHNDPSSDTTQGQTKADIPPVVGPPPAAIPQTPPAPSKQEKPGKHHRWTKDPAMFFVTLALAVFALLAWIETRQGTKALQDQLNVLRDDQRPWVFESSAELLSDLYIAEDSAKFSAHFQLQNVGKSPAKSVSIAGSFIFTHGAPREAYEGWKVCDLLRHAPIQAVPGRVIFPNQIATQNYRFAMDRADILAWRQWKEGEPAALIAAGCIDYFFGDSPIHHQTRFIYELDKLGTREFPFLMIPGSVGQIAANQLGLAFNPGLAKDAD